LSARLFDREEVAQTASDTNNAVNTIQLANKNVLADNVNREIADSISLEDLLGLPPRIEHAPKHQLDMSVPLSQKYDHLVNSANNGNAEAALELALSLSHCSPAPATSEQYENRRNTISQTRMVPGRIYPIDDIGAELEQLQKNYRFCKSMTRDQIRDLYVYIKMAAENGNLQAKTELTAHGGLYEDEVFEALARAWDTGEEMATDSLRYLTESMQEGNLDALYKLGAGQGIGEFQISRTEAAAYRIAGAYLSILAGRSDAARYNAKIDSVRGSLTPHEEREALRRAKKLVQRENCCFSFNIE